MDCAFFFDTSDTSDTSDTTVVIGATGSRDRWYPSHSAALSLRVTLVTHVSPVTPVTHIANNSQHVIRVNLSSRLLTTYHPFINSSIHDSSIHRNFLTIFALQFACLFWSLINTIQFHLQLRIFSFSQTIVDNLTVILHSYPSLVNLLLDPNFTFDQLHLPLNPQAGPICNNLIFFFRDSSSLPFHFHPLPLLLLISILQSRTLADTMRSLNIRYAAATAALLLATQIAAADLDPIVIKVSMLRADDKEDSYA